MNKQDFVFKFLVTSYFTKEVIVIKILVIHGPNLIV